MNTSNQVNSHRTAARVIGILFIAATASAILGLLLYQPILTGSDYLTVGAAHKYQIILGGFMELILVCAAIGTAVGLFPILRKYNESLALAHLSFRFLEAVIITIGIVAILSLLTLSQSFVSADNPNVASFQTSGGLLQSVYKWTSMFGPLFMLGLNTLIYSYLFYKSKLVPRLLAILGLTGAILVICYGFLVMFGIAPQLSAWALLALPVALYEMVLAGWLIVKGFNPQAITKGMPNEIHE